MTEKETVEQKVKQVDDEIAGLLSYFKEKHEEFDANWNVLQKIKDKQKKTAKIDVNKVLLVLGGYPALADWYLTEYQIAVLRYTKLDEQYSLWYGPCAVYANTEMKKNGEHITQGTIKSKVAVLWPDDSKKWQEALAKAKFDMEALKKRLDIIHDARYTLNALSMLRPIWDETARGDRPVPPSVDDADQALKNQK